MSLQKLPLRKADAEPLRSQTYQQKQLRTKVFHSSYSPSSTIVNTFLQAKTICLSMNDSLPNVTRNYQIRQLVEAPRVKISS
mmetsp:Transcript_6268/g.7732  ORF Transcript_6268/g.7732 Transcript_6268/m.7732 type:complete len:82 (-) Transcript_6268:617-862(-)